jgi:hypothetical protein
MTWTSMPSGSASLITRVTFEPSPVSCCHRLRWLEPMTIWGREQLFVGLVGEEPQRQLARGGQVVGAEEVGPKPHGVREDSRDLARTVVASRQVRST